jgi:hypothetical protein
METMKKEAANYSESFLPPKDSRPNCYVTPRSLNPVFFAA